MPSVERWEDVEGDHSGWAVRVAQNALAPTDLERHLFESREQAREWLLGRGVRITTDKPKHILGDEVLPREGQPIELVAIYEAMPSQEMRTTRLKIESDYVREQEQQVADELEERMNR